MWLAVFVSAPRSFTTLRAGEHGDTFPIHSRAVPPRSRDEAAAAPTGPPPPLPRRGVDEAAPPPPAPPPPHPPVEGRAGGRMVVPVPRQRRRLHLPGPGQRTGEPSVPHPDRRGPADRRRTGTGARGWG